MRISRGGSSAHAARKLASSRNVVCASPTYLRKHGTPRAPQDLAGHACVGYTYWATGDDWHFTDAQGKPHVVRIRCVMHTNNGDTARAAALAGTGIIQQPSFLVGPDVRAGRLVALLPNYHVPDIAVLALYPSRRHLSAKVRGDGGLPGRGLQGHAAMGALARSRAG